eukprot:Pompholyxophrys_sp_v1_NODE_341_length_713_cov_2.653495.p1 type:complete len:216 gc:universal NODE_341_length_713_cov_2.653495:666-19(-)
MYKYSSTSNAAFTRGMPSNHHFYKNSRRMAGGIPNPFSNVQEFASKMVNKFIEKSPFEMHLPGYQFAGPGTKFKQREAAGQRGINDLDNGAYWHDKTYEAYGPGVQRAEADKQLYSVSQKVIGNPQAPSMERFWARNVVSPAMQFQMKNNAKKGIPDPSTEMTGSGPPLYHFTLPSAPHYGYAPKDGLERIMRAKRLNAQQSSQVGMVGGVIPFR